MDSACCPVESERLNYLSDSSDIEIDGQNARIFGKGQKAMTTRDTIEAVRESPLWGTLSIGEKLDALLYAVESAEEVLANRREYLDISDIVGEIFADYTN